METAFSPNWVSKPGNTIKAILEERNLKQSVFAYCMRMTADEMEALINADIEIDEKIATKLACTLGASVQFWLNREKQYREGVTRLATADRDLHLSNVTD